MSRRFIRIQFFCWEWFWCFVTNMKNCENIETIVLEQNIKSSTLLMNKNSDSIYIFQFSQKKKTFTVKHFIIFTASFKNKCEDVWCINLLVLTSRHDLRFYVFLSRRKMEHKYLCISEVLSDTIFVDTTNLFAFYRCVMIQ